MKLLLAGAGSSIISAGGPSSVLADIKKWAIS